MSELLVAGRDPNWVPRVPVLVIVKPWAAGTYSGVCPCGNAWAGRSRAQVTCSVSCGAKLAARRHAAYNAKHAAKRQPEITQAS